MTNELEHLYQQIGATILADINAHGKKYVLYCEAEDGVVSADIFYSSSSEKVLFKFSSSNLRDLVYKLWQQGGKLPNGQPWAVMFYSIENNKFSIDFMYPNQIDCNEDLIERRTKLIGKYFDTNAIDYSKP